MTTEFPIAINVSDDCLGTAQCVMTAPELFDLDDEDQSRPRREIYDESDLALARIAVRSCPTRAITLATDE